MPVPGVPRSFSLMWTWTKCPAMALDRRPRALLLDVGVEGVVHRAEARMIDALHQFLGLGRRGQEVALEAVEIFDGQHDLVLLGELGRLPQHLDGRGSFRRRWGRCRRRPPSGEWYGPAQVFAAEDGRHLDGPLVPIDGGLANAGIGADRVRVRPDHGDRRAAEALLLQLRGDRLVVVGVAFEERQSRRRRSRSFSAWRTAENAPR